MAVPPFAEMLRSRGVANADGVAGIAAAIDVGDRDGAAAGRRCRNPTIPGGGDVACARIPTAKELALKVLEARLG
ncbi:MAG: hypothetical protein K0R44_2786 [Thermomicrobiales bacterium]|nr:hypothetical protein [Thermomicrobiales bacterium]